MATAHTYLERVDTCFLDGSPWEQCPRVCADGVCILVFFIMIQIYGWWLRPLFRPLPTLQARPILHVAAPGCEYARAGSAKSTGAMCWKVHALPPFVVEVVQSWLSNRARAESWRMREKWLFKKKKAYSCTCHCFVQAFLLRSNLVRMVGVQPELCVEHVYSDGKFHCQKKCLLLGEPLFSSFGQKH